MNSGLIFCPRCGADGSGGIRFCRQCGTNLEAVEKVLSGSHTQPQSVPSTAESEHPLKHLKRDMFWLAVRGIVTVVIAFPFALLTLQMGGAISLILTLVLLAFVVLGILDVTKVFATLRDPLAALAKLNAQKDVQTEVASRGALESPAEGEEGIAPPTNPLPGVTEHTTLELKNPKQSSVRN